MNRETLKKILLDQWEGFWQQDYGIEREQLPYLKKLVNQPQAVVISGMRRVGKSTLLFQLAKTLGKRKFYYTNFEDERLLKITSADLQKIYEVQAEIFGERGIFLFDEIQNVPGWERFVRRMSDQKYKFFITGSNASLLSPELGTKLTGRYIPIKVFPFSFSEFIRFKKKALLKTKDLTTKQSNKFIRLTNEYLKKGGLPGSLRFPQVPVLQNLYDDILYRDVAARYQITELRALKELAFFLISNIGNPISFNKLKEQLKLGSVNTVKNYIDYMENGWLLMPVNLYSFSVKRQQIAPKKIYSIDTGIVQSVAFSFSENKGHFLENAVFVSLKRKNNNIYYYKTSGNREVDFFVPEKKILVQVSQDVSDPDTKSRETESLAEAMEETGIKSSFLITETMEETIKSGSGTIKVVPAYKYL